MQKENDEITFSINCLPNEIISIILKSNDCGDILLFGSTCKRFNEMVNSDQCLWKEKMKITLPEDIIEVVDQHCDGDWLGEIKNFYTLRQQIYRELISMSARYYSRITDVTLEDVRNFFAIALSSNWSYYCTIYLLQDIIRQGKKNIEEFKCQKPFTLTEMFYARVALRHLIHTYLAVKWVKEHMRNELTPEIVINFFVQWLDTDHLHPDEDVQKKINGLAKKVETLLEQDYPSKSNSSSVQERCAKGLVSERKVLAAVTQVIYHQRHMVVSAAANLDSLDIVGVIDRKYGNVIAVAAIYQAVARTFNVNCELIAFPNHLFLEWKDNSDYRMPQVYTIDLSTGELHIKRRCPFSQANQTSDNKYFPDSLLQYIYSSYHSTMGVIKNWLRYLLYELQLPEMKGFLLSEVGEGLQWLIRNTDPSSIQHGHRSEMLDAFKGTQNALHLLDFLGTYDNEHNPYRNFLPYLLDLPSVNMPRNLKYLSDVHLQIIRTLAYLNTAHNNAHRCRTAVVKNRSGRVKFAVGMICYHRIYDYICVIRGWDQNCAIVEWQTSSEIDSLSFGPNQPFYHVIAADQSMRYVAQENLNEFTRPTRLYHLEDHIAREFTHFDGFAYVPNDEKRAEYPGEDLIRHVIRNRCELKPANRPPL